MMRECTRYIQTKTLGRCELTGMIKRDLVRGSVRSAAIAAIHGLRTVKRASVARVQ
jgi:hypothetical protein